MGLWSSTFGDGNSLEQSIDNQFGSSQGSYVGGSWTGSPSTRPDGVKGPNANRGGDNDYDALYDESTGGAAGGLVGRKRVVLGKSVVLVDRRLI